MGPEHRAHDSRDHRRVEQTQRSDRPLARVPDEDLCAVLDPEANSLALILKYLSGNLRSRWTDFLTSGEEKSFRSRESEFLSSFRSRFGSGRSAQ